MPSFLLRRMASMLLVWLGVTILTFFISNVVPRDPVALHLGPKATQESITKWRHEYGLDQPLPVQYLRFLQGILRGDLGKSVWSGRAITRDLQDYLPGTLELALTTLLVTVVIGVPLGVLAASSRGRWVDDIIQVFATFGLALPLFWVGLVLQIIFYSRLDLLPLDSRIDLVIGPPDRWSGFYLLDSLRTWDVERIKSVLIHLVLPTVTLALPMVGGAVRMTRASILEVTAQDYVRTARAKGASKQRVMWKHILRNALLPVVTVLGNIFNNLLAGVFVVEAIFNWPGLGWYASRVILASDYGAIVSITLVIAVLCTFVNLLVDILYHALDPRIRFA